MAAQGKAKGRTQGTGKARSRRTTRRAGQRKAQGGAKGKAKRAAPARGKRAARAKAKRAAPAKARVRRTNRSRAAKARSRKTAIAIPANYRPSEDEEFMGVRQREYFRRKLIEWRNEILAESRETIEHLREQNSQEPDIADRASIETERLIELRTRDRERKLLSKIDAALKRIEDGSYGYCLETGDPISLRRLEARPIATLSIDAQERHERLEKTYRDD